jgi:hypothetical protein
MQAGGISCRTGGNQGADLCKTLVVEGISLHIRPDEIGSPW